MPSAQRSHAHPEPLRIPSRVAGGPSPETRRSGAVRPMDRCLAPVGPTRLPRGGMGNGPARGGPSAIKSGSRSGPPPRGPFPWEVFV